jgi:hypothetical protein
MFRSLLFCLALISVSSYAGGEDCYDLHGKIDSLVTATNCTSPVGLCTQGSISKGVLKGKTFYTVEQILGESQPDGPTAPPTLTYVGQFVITAHDGSTLTFRDLGLFDEAQGLDCSQCSQFVGTGQFAGASGTLFFYGTGTAMGFKENFSGKLCIPRKW